MLSTLHFLFGFLVFGTLYWHFYIVFLLAIIFYFLLANYLLKVLPFEVALAEFCVLTVIIHNLGEASISPSTLIQKSSLLCKYPDYLRTRASKFLSVNPYKLQPSHRH